MKRSYRRATAAATFMCLALVAACGGDDDDAATTPSTEAVDEGAATSSAEPADETTTSGAEPADETTTSGAESTSTASSAPAADLAAPDSVSIQICGGVGTQFASFYAAEGTGLFDEIDEQFGTDISLDLSFGGGTECTAAFIGGQNDFTSMSPAISAVMGTQGEDATAIMETFLGTTLVLIGAVSEQESRGTDLANWGDSTWAVTGPGATTETVPKALLEGAGVDTASVTFLPVGNVTAMTAAFQSGQVNGMAAPAAAAIELINAGLAYEILNANDPEVIRPLLGDILGAQGMTTTLAFAEEYPELTQAIINALHEALIQVQELGEDGEAVLALFPPDLQEQLGPGFVDQWAYIAPGFATVDSVVTPAEATATLDFQTTYAGADFSSLPDTFFDNTYALRSYEDLGLEPPADIPIYPQQG